MIADKLLWEENHLNYSGVFCIGCCFVLTILYVFFNYIFPPLIEGDLSVLILLFILIPILIFSYWIIIVSTSIQGQFHIQFFENCFYLRTILRKKVFDFSQLAEIMIILGNRKDWSIKPKRRPRRYYNQVKVIFKITYALNQKVKKYPIHARFNASKRDYGVQAKSVVLESRLEFENKIKNLSIMFPKLITIIDSLDPKSQLNYGNRYIGYKRDGNVKICPNCGDQNDIAYNFCQHCGFKF